MPKRDPSNPSSSGGATKLESVAGRFSLNSIYKKSMLSSLACATPPKKIIAGKVNSEIRRTNLITVAISNFILD